jgi:hypothetical protein
MLMGNITPAPNSWQRRAHSPQSSPVPLVPPATTTRATNRHFRGEKNFADQEDFRDYDLENRGMGFPSVHPEDVGTGLLHWFDFGY